MALRYTVRPQQFFIFFDGSCCDQKPFIVMTIVVRIGVHVRWFNPHHFAITRMLSQILAGVQKRAPRNVSTIQQMIHIVRCVVSSIDLQIASSTLREEWTHDVSKQNVVKCDLVYLSTYHYRSAMFFTERRPSVTLLLSVEFYSVREQNVRSGASNHDGSTRCN